MNTETGKTMHILTRYSALLALALTGGTAATDDAATKPPHGELAAAVRSAGMPCAHVQAVSAAGTDRWEVRCNAGVYLVEGQPGGSWSVRPAD